MTQGLFRIQGIVRAYTVAPELARTLGRRPMSAALRTQALQEGSARKVMEHHNLILDQGLEAIAKFLGGGAGAPLVGGGAVSDIADLVIAEMELGNAASPPDPQVTDTNGVTSPIYQPLVTVSYPTAFSIMFSGLLPIEEANGETITEESLRMTNGLVFAKSTFSRSKNNLFALQFDHQILFARA